MSSEQRHRHRSDGPTRIQRLTLELESGEPIRGRLLDDAGAAYHFHGWLELNGALERAWRGGAEGKSGVGAIGVQRR
jgi:hypothetical protein